MKRSKQRLSREIEEQIQDDIEKQPTWSERIDESYAHRTLTDWEAHQMHAKEIEDEQLEMVRQIEREERNIFNYNSDWSEQW